MLDSSNTGIVLLGIVGSIVTIGLAVVAILRRRTVPPRLRKGPLSFPQTRTDNFIPFNDYYVNRTFIHAQLEYKRKWLRRSPIIKGCTARMAITRIGGGSLGTFSCRWASNKEQSVDQPEKKDIDPDLPPELIPLATRKDGETSVFTLLGTNTVYGPYKRVLEPGRYSFMVEVLSATGQSVASGQFLITVPEHPAVALYIEEAK